MNDKEQAGLMFGKYRRLRKENEELRNALEFIESVLGPEEAGCSFNECRGCLYEMNKALEVAKNALKERKK